MPCTSKRNACYRRKAKSEEERESVSVASKILRDEHNNASHTNGGRHLRTDNLKQANRGNIVQNLESSLLSIDERETSCQKHRRQQS
jgi:hypothetical protein